MSARGGLGTRGGSARASVLAAGLGVVLVVLLVVPLAGCSGDSSPASRPSVATGTARAGTPAAGVCCDERQGVDEPTRPESAIVAARRIRRAERAIADPATSRNELLTAAWSEQAAYRETIRHQRWEAAVLAAVPADLRRLVRHNIEARRAFADISHTLADTLPAWRIERPLPPGHLLRLYHAAARRYGVGWSVLAALNIVESACGRIHGLSTAGAQGPMQFLPSTWATYGDGGDIDDPADAVPAAARFLVAHGARRPGGLAGALYGYNNSSAYVRGVTLLARIMARHPRSFLGYYHWRIYYRTTAGDVLLRVGYDQPRPVPAARYLAAHPGARF